MEETIILVVNHWIFKAIIGTMVTTLTGWAMISARNTSNRIKQAPTSDDLAKIKDEAFRYTDSRINLHEKDHKPILDSICDIRADNVRIESKIDKLLMIMIEKK